MNFTEMVVAEPFWFPYYSVRPTAFHLGSREESVVSQTGCAEPISKHPEELWRIRKKQGAKA
jgi:hypothetical protein